jgi:hypothetical protein
MRWRGARGVVASPDQMPLSDAALAIGMSLSAMSALRQIADSRRTPRQVRNCQQRSLVRRRVRHSTVVHCISVPTMSAPL